MESNEYQSLLIGVDLHAIFCHDSLHRPPLVDPGVPHNVDCFQLIPQFEKPTQIWTLFAEASVRVILQRYLCEGGQLHFCQYMQIYDIVLT